jgi:putative CocE/NonD family hydrolase
VTAAVLNVSGWYDEAYGPEGATTNFMGLVESRRGAPNARASLILGPWVHGVAETETSRTGDLDFGPEAAIDYDEMVLRWMDHHLRGIDNGVGTEDPVQFFVMGANQWQTAGTWPPPGSEPMPLYLTTVDSVATPGMLSISPPVTDSDTSSLSSDPLSPVTDPFVVFGPHDYRALAGTEGVLIFDSQPLEQDLEVTGAITAGIYISCDCPDTDLWIRLLDVSPDGSAYNLMSPGLDVLRASYRNLPHGRQLLKPGEVYRLDFQNLVTSNVFRKGHRIRLQVSTAFAPHFSRNLHTGLLEIESAEARLANLRIHHDRQHPSAVVLSVVSR